MATAKFIQPAHKMPDFSTEAALSLLWRKASSQLHTHELEWLASNAAVHAGDNAGHLSEVLQGLSCLIRDDGDCGHFASADAASSLIHGIAVQLSTIAGMVNIAAEATSRVSLAGRAA